MRSALEAFGTQDRAYIPQGPHPARLRQDAHRPNRSRRRGRVVRHGEQAATVIARAMRFRVKIAIPYTLLLANFEFFLFAVNILSQPVPKILFEYRQKFVRCFFAI